MSSLPSAGEKQGGCPEFVLHVTACWPCPAAVITTSLGQVVVKGSSCREGPQEHMTNRQDLAFPGLHELSGVPLPIHPLVLLAKLQAALSTHHPDFTAQGPISPFPGSTWSGQVVLGDMKLSLPGDTARGPWLSFLIDIINWLIMRITITL